MAWDQKLLTTLSVMILIFRIAANSRKKFIANVCGLHSRGLFQKASFLVYSRIFLKIMGKLY
jgi:hypothetical protein